MCRHESRISSSTSDVPGHSPEILDDDLHRPTIGQQTHAVAVALGQPDLVEQPVGLAQIVLAQAER